MADKSLRRGVILALIPIALAVCGGMPALFGKEPRATDENSRAPERVQTPPPEVSARAAFSVVLGRPEDSSICLNLLSQTERDVVIFYGEREASLSKGPLRVTPDNPLTVELTGLSGNLEYEYRVEGGGETLAEGSFKTAKKPGEAFRFEVFGDSHPERPQQFSAELYGLNLRNAAADGPDFFILIGDDFSVDTLPKVTKEAVHGIFLRQRQYLSLIGSVASVFLVNGNHEQASLANLDGTPDNVAVWSQNYRNGYFALPAPDRFYSGNRETVAHIGPLRDYYAWTWGDALFAVIDPYWHSPQPVDNTLGNMGEKTRDLWNNTLGKDQYEWLKNTLETSDATFKFVFSHHVLGTGRGGTALADGYEWGGKSPNGAYEFPSRRPDFAVPIHRLIAENRVTAFIQGHDHVFAREELDGVTYVTLSEPADPNYALYNEAAFRGADVAPNSGRLRVTVTPKEALFEYVREWLPGDAPEGSAQPAYRFTVSADGSSGSGVYDPVQKAMAAQEGSGNQSPKTAEKPAKNAKGRVQ